MAQIAVCDGLITIMGGIPACTGVWVVETSPTLSLADAGALSAAALVPVAVAYGVRYCIRLLFPK